MAKITNQVSKKMKQIQLCFGNKAIKSCKRNFVLSAFHFVLFFL